MSTETVPAPEVIKKWMGDFLIESDQIVGVYRNLDVDSLVFTYQTGLGTESEFENALSSALRNSKWRQSTNVTEYMEFRRSFQKGEKTHRSGDNSLYAPAGLPHVVEIEPGKTYSRLIQLAAYVFRAEHLSPPYTLTATYRILKKKRERLATLLPDADLTDWLKEIGGEKHDLTEYIEPVTEGGEGDTATHRLHVPQAVFLRLWKSLNHARP